MNYAQAIGISGASRDTKMILIFTVEHKNRAENKRKYTKNPRNKRINRVKIGFPIPVICCPKSTVFAVLFCFGVKPLNSSKQRLTGLQWSVGCRAKFSVYLNIVFGLHQSPLYPPYIASFHEAEADVFIAS